MPKVKVKSKRLDVFGVSRISLVSQASNRQCIKVLKGDSQVSKNKGVLSNLFGGSSSEDSVGPTVAGLYVTTDVVEAAEAAIAEAGLTVTEKAEAGETDTGIAVTLFRFDGDHPPVEHVVKMDDNAAVIVAVEKGFNSWPETSNFNEMVAATKFYPGLNRSFETANEVIRNIMWEAQGGPPVEEVAQVLKELTKYILALLKATPEIAYKFDNLKPVEGESDVPSEEVQKGESESIEGDDTSDSEDSDAPTPDISPEDGEVETSSSGVALEVDPSIVTVLKELPEVLARVEGQTEKLVSTQQTLSDQVAVLKSDVERLNKSTGKVPPRDKEAVLKKEDPSAYSTAFKFAGFE